MRAQRSALLGLRHDGVIAEDTFETLTTEVDAQLSDGPASIPARSETSTQFLEVPIPPNARAVGKVVARLGLPRSAVLVSIKRGDEVIIPRGDTRLQSGDVTTLLCKQEQTEDVENVLTKERDKRTPLKRLQ